MIKSFSLMSGRSAILILKECQMLLLISQAHLETLWAESTCIAGVILICLMLSYSQMEAMSPGSFLVLHLTCQTHSTSNRPQKVRDNRHDVKLIDIKVTRLK